MKVELKHGRCRECGAALEVIDADDATMTVECENGHCYMVEPDAFGDGALKYFVGFHAQAMATEEGGDEP